MRRLPRWVLVASPLLALLFLLMISVGVWVYWDSAWLRCTDKYTTVAVRFDGVIGDSPDGRTLRTAVMTRFIKEPEHFELLDLSINSREWPRRYSWMQLIGYTKGIATLESELPLYRRAIEEAVANTGLHVKCHVRIVDRMRR